MAAETTQQQDENTGDEHGKGQAEAAAQAVDAATHKQALDKIEELKRAQAETNRKAASDRKFREDTERDIQKKKDAELPELDRLKGEREAEAEGRKAAERERDDARAEVRAIRLDRAIEKAAAPTFENPELVPRLIDRSRITFDEDTGEAKAASIKDAVDRLAKDYPGLTKSRAGGGSPAAIPARRGGNGNGNGGGERMPTVAEFMVRPEDYPSM